MQSPYTAESAIEYVVNFHPELSTIIPIIHFADDAHKGQTRKNAKASPYISHPIDVFFILLNAGIRDFETLSAALLHDTVEDTNVKLTDITEKFGKKISDIVAECSDNKTLSKIQRKRDQITHVQCASTEAKLVKIADKLSNLSDLNLSPPVGWDKKYIKGYFVWSYAVCKNAMGLNAKLDEELIKMFEPEGLIGISEGNLNKKLEEYYKLC